MRLGTDTPGVRVALVGIPTGARVLDAACGIGIDAIALARRGFAVTATDANSAMVSVTRERTEASGLDIEVAQSTWPHLPERFPDETFDAVLCTGNSISHTAGETEMVAALRGFRGVLTADGIVIIDTLDWEMVRSLGDRVVADPLVVERNGVSCSRSYRWRIPDGLDQPIILQIELSFVAAAGEATTRTHSVTQQPFTRSQMTSRLRSAGLRRISMDAMADDDRYTVVAGHTGSV